MMLSNEVILISALFWAVSDVDLSINEFKDLTIASLWTSMHPSIFEFWLIIFAHW
jgi:hypothetical protein